MKDPLGISPSKGNQGTTRGKEKILLPRWESGPGRNRAHDLRIRSTLPTPTEVKRIFSLPHVVP